MRQKLHLTATIIISLTGFAFFAAQIIGAFFGYDFTDEGYYLNSISNPYSYNNSGTQFGLLYNPIFIILGKNIALIRVFNIVTIFLATLWLFINAYGFVAKEHQDRKDQNRNFGILAGAAAGSLAFAVFWPSATPSYNSLTYLGITISLAAIIQISETRKEELNFRASGIILICGLVLTGLGKPSSMAMLTTALIIYSLLHERHKRYFLWKCILIQVSIYSTVLISQLQAPNLSFGNAKDLLGALQITGGNRYTSGIFDGYRILWERLTDSPLFFTLLIANTGIPRLFKQERISYCIALQIGIAALLAAISGRYITQDNANLYFITLAIGIWINLLFETIISSHKKQSLVGLGLCMLIGLGPVYYVFGTGNPYWHVISLPSSFMVCSYAYGCRQLAESTHKRAIKPNNLNVIILGTIIVSYIYLHPLQLKALTDPYRQPKNVFKHTAVASIGGKDKLLINEEYKYYIHSIVDLLREADFKKNSPVIDMTGASPGVIYAVDGYALGAAWIIGGYPNSNQRFQSALSSAKCDQLAKAWIFVEENGPLAIDSETSNKLGINYKDNNKYARIGTQKMPELLNTKDHPNRSIEVYKPISESEHMCQEHKYRG